MRKIFIAVSIMAMLSTAVPADAGARGQIRLAVAHPSVPHAVWASGARSNGIVGWVFRVPPTADEATYQMLVTGGATGLETTDVYFYEDWPNGSGPGTPCAIRVARESLEGESGTICPGPQVPAWGIVVLVAGTNATFTLTY